MVSCILKSWIAAVMTSNHCLSLCTVLDVLKFRNRDSSIETSLCSFLCITVKRWPPFVLLMVVKSIGKNTERCLI